MNPKILRSVLTWLAPIAIGFIVKKYEQKKAKKAQENAYAQN